MDEVLTMILDCKKRFSKLHEWEQKYILRLEEFIDKGKTLSPSQIDTLENVWDRVTG